MWLHPLVQVTCVPVKLPLGDGRQAHCRGDAVHARTSEVVDESLIHHFYIHFRHVTLFEVCICDLSWCDSPLVTTARAACSDG